MEPQELRLSVRFLTDQLRRAFRRRMPLNSRVDATTKSQSGQSSASVRSAIPAAAWRPTRSPIVTRSRASAVLVRSPAQNVQRGHGAMRSESREAGILADVPQRMRPSRRYGGAGARITTAGQAKRPQRLRVEVVLDPGPDLFSQGPTSRVSSALVGLTAVFGMGTGVTPPLQGPRMQLYQAG